MTKNKDDWTKVEMSPAWKPEKEGDSVEGLFTRMEENVGDNNSNMYYLEQDNGETIGVWGSTVLDVRLKNVKVGEMVKVVYQGVKKSEKTKRDYKDYDVYHKPAPFKKVGDEGIDLDEINFDGGLD